MNDFNRTVDLFSKEYFGESISTNNSTTPNNDDKIDALSLAVENLKVNKQQDPILDLALEIYKNYPESSLVENTDKVVSDHLKNYIK